MERRRLPPSKMDYINGRIEMYRHMLLIAHKFPASEKDEQKRQVKHLTKRFRMMLAEKARQEAIHKVSDNKGSNAQNASTSQADNARPCIRVRDILQKKIARC